LTSFIFSFAALLLFAASSSFFIVLLGHTHFILDVTFSSDLGMPLAFEFLELLCLFGFLTAFSLFLMRFSLAPPVWGVILVGIFFHERKIIEAQKGIARDVLFSECERNNKDDLSSFQAQVVKINKL
jgi:hypothetical protein